MSLRSASLCGARWAACLSTASSPSAVGRAVMQALRRSLQSPVASLLGGGSGNGTSKQSSPLAGRRHKVSQHATRARALITRPRNSQKFAAFWLQRGGARVLNLNLGHGHCRRNLDAQIDVLCIAR